MSPTHQDLSNDTTFSQIKSRVPVPLKEKIIYSAPVNIFTKAFHSSSVHTHRSLRNNYFHNSMKI